MAAGTQKAPVPWTVWSSGLGEECSAGDAHADAFKPKSVQLQACWVPCASASCAAGYSLRRSPGCRGGCSPSLGRVEEQAEPSGVAGPLCLRKLVGFLTNHAVRHCGGLCLKCLQSRSTPWGSARGYGKPRGLRVGGRGEHWALSCQVWSLGGRDREPGPGVSEPLARHVLFMIYPR